MARALLGHVGTTQDHLLALEVVRLRRRVKELEAEVARLHEVRGDAATVDIDLELHRITEAPVLA